MSVPKLLDEAVARLEAAAGRIKAARMKAVSVESLHEWTEVLTDFTLALSDVQSFNNESVHEKIHVLAGRVGLREFPARQGG
jgi:hypothetical protein